MTRYKIAGMLAAVAAMALPVAVSASTNVTFLTLNGGPNVTIPLGETAQANVQYDLIADTTTSDTESFSWQVLDGAGNAALPPVCVNSSDRTTAGTYNSSFPVGTGGQTEGTWDIRVRLYGTPGTGANNNCQGTPTDSMTFTNVLTLTTPEDSNTQAGNPFPGDSTGFCALFPASCTNTGTGVTPPPGYNFGAPGSSLTIFCQNHPVLCGFTPPTMPPQATSTPDKTDLILAALGLILTNQQGGGSGQSCQALTAASVGAFPGTTSQANSNLQVFLMSQGEHITNSGVSTLFYGPLTANAVTSFKAKHNCN